jgi:hypothetical protein
MAIKEVYDEVNDVNITMVEGVVEQMSFKAVENDKFGNTHRAGVRVGDDWVNNISIKVNEGFDPQIRFNAGTKVKPDWATLEVGDTVKIVVQPNEYNGKTYYNSGVSKIRLVKKGEGKASQQASGSAPKSNFQKKDMSGVHTGHAINVAMNVLGDVEDSDAIIEAAKKAHELTTKLKKEYQANNPDMSDYDVGAMVGQSVLSASHYVENVADIEDIARQTLDVVVPAVSEYVKASGEEKKPAVVKKTAAKKTPAKKATKKAPVVEDDTEIEDVDIPDSAYDDDIPF